MRRKEIVVGIRRGRRHEKIEGSKQILEGEIAEDNKVSRKYIRCNM